MNNNEERTLCKKYLCEGGSTPAAKMMARKQGFVAEESLWSDALWEMMGELRTGGKRQA